MNRNQRKFFNRIFFQTQHITLLVCAVFFFLILRPVLLKKQELLRKFDLVHKQIARVVDKNRFFEERIFLLENSLEHIEKLAREKLGMKRPRETVYKFVSSSRNVKKSPKEIKH